MTEQSPERDRAVLDRLKTVRAQLQTVYAGIVVVTAALRHQGAEQDDEVATVLQFLVGDRLGEQIEQLSDVVENWSSRGSVRECTPASSWDEPRAGAQSHAGRSSAGCLALEWTWQCRDDRAGYGQTAAVARGNRRAPGR